jgi:hypothetical protein
MNAFGGNRWLESSGTIQNRTQKCNTSREDPQYIVVLQTYLRPGRAGRVGAGDDVLAADVFGGAVGAVPAQRLAAVDELERQLLEAVLAQRGDPRADAVGVATPCTRARA